MPKQSKGKRRETRVPVTFTARVDEWMDYDHNVGFSVELPIVLHDCVKDGQKVQVTVELEREPRRVGRKRG